MNSWVGSGRQSWLALLFVVVSMACQRAADHGDVRAASNPQRPDRAWVGSWATGPQLTEPRNLPPAPGLAGNTLHQFVFPTLAGQRVRLQLSNQWGDDSVTLNAVHIAATAAPGGAIEAGNDVALYFAGSPSVTIPAGESVWSDPQAFSLQALTPLAVSIHFGNVPKDITGHPGSRTTSYIEPGGVVSVPNLSRATPTEHWYFITRIDVETTPAAAAIAVLGDSLTDGRGSTTNGNNRWPDNLARRIRSSDSLQDIAVLNLGIGGNAVLEGGLGPTGLERYERDVLDQSGVRWAIVLAGVNDIGASTDSGVADRLIRAYQQFIAKARARGIHIYGSPVLPFAGSQYDSPEHESARQAVNSWIRTSGAFDAVLDLDAAVRDPSDPTRLLPAYDDGDHLHLNVAGYQAMADAVDLSLFASGR